MKIPPLALSNVSQSAAKRILAASKNEKNICQQMQMANYYAFLHSKNCCENDCTNYAKMLLGK